MATCLEDLSTELFFTIFDYLWAHELFDSFSNLNQRIDEILRNTQLHISTEKEIIQYSPDHVLSLTLTSSPISLEEFTNLRSLTLIRCHFNDLDRFPSSLTRLCIKNTNLSNANLQLILQSSRLINVQLNLFHKLTFSSTLLNIDENFSNIEYLTINYISFNDIVQLLSYTKKLKYLHLSLFSINENIITNYSPIPTVTRVVCLAMGIPFDLLCSQFLSIYFPNLTNLSVFTSFVEQDLFIHSLEHLLKNNSCIIRKLNVSAQFIINRTLINDNIECIATRFRTAFWLKRNCRVTFKYCDENSHTIRVYLQMNKKLRTRPSRF